MITVVNKYKHKFGEFNGVDVYIGRGTPLGNPYTHINDKKTKAEFVVETREEAIANYESWLLSKVEEKDKPVCDMLNALYVVAKEQPLNLVCTCAPKSCHGDVVKKLLESKLKWVS